MLRNSSYSQAVVIPAAANRENWLTYLTLIPIAGGVVIASGGEPLFNIIGFTACLLATSGRALKTVVQVSPASTALQCALSIMLATEMDQKALTTVCLDVQCLSCEKLVCCCSCCIYV